MMLHRAFAGVPLFRTGWRAPQTATAWMRAPLRPGATPPPQFTWQRALAYRAASGDPQRASQWRSQFDALAQRSWQKYRQTVPGASKLTNPAAMQSILRDLQNARVSLNDMQVRAKAAELRVITDYLRRPDVASVRVIPSSSGGRTPDLYVTYRGGRPSERVEVRTITGSAIGWRRSPVVPGTRAFDAERLARAIDSKIKRGQLTSTIPGVGSGGTIAIRMEAPLTKAQSMAREAIDRLASRLIRTPQVRQIEIHTGGQLITFVRQPNGKYTPTFTQRIPLGVERARARQAIGSRRRTVRRRRRR